MQKRVIIVGGGFAGLAAARRLHPRKDIHVQLLEPRTQFEFTPLIPSLFGGHLKPGDLRLPLASAARRWGFELRHEAAARINLKNASVTAQRGKYVADAILLACGARWGDALGNTPEAGCFRLASVAEAVAARDRLLTGNRANWVVVGGGQTGVELAANLAVMAKTNHLSAKVVLVEARDRICPDLSPSLSGLIAAHLHALGVEILLQSVVESFEDQDVAFRDGGCIHDAFLLMANGMAAVELPGLSSIPQSVNRQIGLQDDLRVAGCDSLFAAGDFAFLNYKKTAVPRCSAARAVQQGDFAAANILRLIDGKRLAKAPEKQLPPLVPLANGCGVGTLLGWPIAGRLPGFLFNRFLARQKQTFAPRPGETRATPASQRTASLDPTRLTFASRPSS